MAFDYHFTCPLPHGIHARPASAIEEVARRFTADVSLVNGRTGQAANAKSVLAIIGLDIRHGDPCRVVTVGADARWAIESLRVFFDDVFPHADDALPPLVAPAGVVRLPRLLERAQPAVHAGTPAVPGIAQGRAVSLSAFTLPDSIPATTGADADSTVERLQAALAALTDHYDQEIETRGQTVEAGVLRAHRGVARDPELLQRLIHDVREHHLTAGGAIVEAERHFTGLLIATGNALLRERALDVRDVCLRLLKEIYGEQVVARARPLGDESVVIADALTPGQFMSLERGRVKGLVLVQGGTTSHTVILARSSGIPTLVGVTTVDPASIDGREVVVDANLGILVTGQTDGSRRYYAMERSRAEARRRRMQRFLAAAGETADGRRVEVAANVSSAEDVRVAMASGAEGVGLFRTEMLFVDRKQPPSEEEQFEEYRRALEHAGQRSVIIRTLDIGGDKPVPYLALPREENPFLGNRAVRFYPAFEALFRTQVRALLRASAFGRLRVMVPMVARLGEARWVRGIVDEERGRLAAEGHRIGTTELGAMVEVPSAAFGIAGLCRELDFFSVGTNDLLQYFMAADRGNREVASLLDPHEPAFLRLLDLVVREAHANGRWVGLCGEMGGRLRSLPLLVGVGFDEVSMAAPAILAAKALLADLSAAGCRSLVESAFGCATAGEVESLLDTSDYRRQLPLIDPDLVVTASDAGSKEEAIKAAVDRLSIVGRTEHPLDVEDAIWQRELVYSTGIGHGFAIPHCKTDAVRASSLVLLELRQPIEWGSLDDQPVRVIIALAIRASGDATAHMKVLAALARKLMHEEFRERLLQERDATELCRVLTEALG